MAKKEIKNADLRVRKGSFSYQDLAKEVGVHWTTVSRWFISDMDQVKEMRVIKAIETLEKKREQERAGK